MALRIWFALFVLFLVYTCFVYVQSDEKNTNQLPDARVAAGWKLWQDKNCQSCHQIYGLGGYLGPDLTNIVSEKGKGEQYMMAFMKHGTARMPDFNMSDTEIHNVVLFLSWVDKSGKNRVEESSVHWSGNYIINN